MSVTVGTLELEATNEVTVTFKAADAKALIELASAHVVQGDESLEELLFVAFKAFERESNKAPEKRKSTSGQRTDLEGNERYRSALNRIKLHTAIRGEQSWHVVRATILAERAKAAWAMGPEKRRLHKASHLSTFKRDFGWTA